MKDAIVARRGVRVTLWNMTAKREGFWNCIAIYPSHDGRYFLSVQARRHAVTASHAATALLHTAADSTYYIRLQPPACSHTLHYILHMVCR
mgnify:FL=1|tara:strand:- start:968 stop:1240 length:273 start_codon:yes stop_codon:yes gene_type:complete